MVDDWSVTSGGFLEGGRIRGLDNYYMLSFLSSCRFMFRDNRSGMFRMTVSSSLDQSPPPTPPLAASVLELRLSIHRENNL